MCVLLSCKDRVISIANEKVVVEDIENVEYIKYDDDRFIESWSMVELEMGNNSLIGGIAQLQLFEERLYILDSQTREIAVFNVDGSFLRKIGAKGRGPQEHLSLCSFYINPDKREITLFDAMLTRRALVFDLNGKFVDTKDVPQDVVTQSINNAAYIGDGLIVCYADPNGLAEDVLFILNEEDMTIVDRLATRPMELEKMIFDMATQPYSIVDGKLHYVKWFDNNIYEWDRGESTPLFEVDTGKPPVPKKYLATVAENNSGSYFDTVRQLVDEGEYSVGLRNLYETSRFMFCEFENGGFLDDLVAWDKRRINSAHITERPSLRVPDVGNIVFSSDDKLVVYWRHNLIESFQRSLRKGEDVNTGTIDPLILETLQNYDATTDNPVLFIYDIKK
jgi:hypothetical protein